MRGRNKGEDTWECRKCKVEILMLQYNLPCVFSLGTRRLRGDMLVVLKYLKSCHMKEGVDFSCRPRGITSIKTWKLQQRIFTHCKEELSDSAQHWYRLLHEVTRIVPSSAEYLWIKTTVEETLAGMQERSWL